MYSCRDARTGDGKQQTQAMSSAGLKEWDLRGMGDTLFKQSSSSDQAHKEKRTDIQCTNGQYL